MAELVAEGKVRHLGSPRPRSTRSAAPPPCTRSPRCRASGRCGAATSRTRSCRRCRELGIGIVPFSPLGRGFLTGAITSHRRPRRERHAPQPARGSPARRSTPTSTVVDVVRASPPRTAARPAQVALAWLLAKGPDVVPDPGHQARRLPRGEPRRRRGRALRRRHRPPRRGHRRRRARRRPDLDQPQHAAAVDLTSSADQRASRAWCRSATPAADAAVSPMPPPRRERSTPRRRERARGSGTGGDHRRPSSAGRSPTTRAGSGKDR